MSLHRNGSCGAILHQLSVPYTWINIPCDYKFPSLKSKFACEDRPVVHHTYIINITEYYCPTKFIYIKHQCVKITEFYRRQQCQQEIVFPPTFSQLEIYITSWIKPPITGKILILRKVGCFCLVSKPLVMVDITNWKQESCNCQTPTILCQRDAIKRDNWCTKFHWKCRDSTCILLKYRCDGVRNCLDGSDEEMCHTICGGSSNCIYNCKKPTCFCDIFYYQCTSGGCIPFEHVCDGISQCLSNDDETVCFKSKHVYDAQEINNACAGNCQDSCKNKWSKCAFIGGNDLCFPNSQICVFERDIFGKVKFCPYTEHLRYCVNHECPGMFKCKDTYCIPLFTVCDGVYDCPDKGDENNCEVFSCPGYLKCNVDNVCVNLLDVCDDIIHCKFSKDDEAHCYQVRECPSNCICAGNIVKCTNKLNLVFKFGHSVVLVLDTIKVIKSRYKVSPNIVMLSLIKCNMDIISFKLPNLKYLRLEYSPLHIFDHHSFINFPNIIEIYLKLCLIHTVRDFSFNNLKQIEELNLSHINLFTIETKTFTGIVNLQILLLNNNDLEIIPAKAFINLTQLDYIDLSGNNIGLIYSSMFNINAKKSLKLMTDSRELCCGFPINSNCTPTLISEDSFSVCRNIAEYYSIQYIGFIISGVIVFLNISLIIVKIIKYKIIHINIKLMYYSLVASHLVGSVGIFVVQLYNSVYFDHFYFLQTYWRNSLQCQISSCFVLVSIHNSAVTNAVIDYNSWILIKFPMMRRGASLSTVYMGLIYMWFIVPFTIQITLMHTDMHVSCSVFRIYFKQNYAVIILTSFIITVKFISSIIVFYLLYDIDMAITENLSVNISSSRERTQRFLQLKQNMRHKVIFKVLDLILFVVIFISLPITASNDMHFLLLYLFIFHYTSTEVLNIYHSLYKKRNKKSI